MKQMIEEKNELEKKSLTSFIISKYTGHLYKLLINNQTALNIGNQNETECDPKWQDQKVFMEWCLVY